MAVQAFKNAYVEVDGNDLSLFIRSVTINYSAEALDKTGVGDNTRTRFGGLKDVSIDMEFYQDFDASSVDSILFPLVGSSTVAIMIKPSTTNASSTNPAYTLNTAFLENFNPIAGSVGEVMMSPVRFTAGSSDLLRQTST